MRLPTLLLALAAALGASGCGLFDGCGSSPLPARSFAGVEVVADAAPAPDTLTIAFVGPASGTLYVTEPIRDVPFEAAGSRLRLRADARVLAYGTSAPRFETVARGDTVFVQLQDINDLIRLVCSPPEPSLELTVTSLRVPAGVLAVRVVALDPYDATVPTARSVRAPRRTLLTA